MKGSEGGALSAGCQRGLGCGATDAAAFLQLFPKNFAFLGIFWSKFLLKIAFLNGESKCVRPQDRLRPETRAPTCPSPATPLSW